VAREGPGSTARHYLCVFTADEDVTTDVVDLGQDPDFRPPTPTWGICRPDIRSRVRAGSYVVFVGYLRAADRYLAKGWLRVAASISYLQALERFPDRPNVIIRDSDVVRGIPSVPRRWKRPHLEIQAEKQLGTPTPSFLTSISVADRHLVQLPSDDHQIDNWKCQRMFRCRESQLQSCITADSCLREDQFPSLRGYIVADEYRDVGPARLEWQAVAPPDLAGRALATPRRRWHNPLPLSSDTLAAILARLPLPC
jgi:hypothetical protein